MKNLFLALIFWVIFHGATAQEKSPVLPAINILADQYYGVRADWYLKNIPFFECSDKKLEQVYYYRWRLLKAHLRNIGEKGYVFTEFLNGMSWDLKPYNTINCATPFHIYEARWLKNHNYVEDYINYMYKSGGNDRHFTESIADASYAYYKVNPDIEFITSQLKDMLRIYEAWDDKYDSTKQLYYIEPINDATEYSISSIEASGGKDGFKGGFAFRPSINAYMYANALAIKNIASLAGKTTLATSFEQKAKQIKNIFQDKMWNKELNHFTDRYQKTNKFVKYWDFIPGRELIGFVPWVFNMPDDKSVFNRSWKQLTDTNAFNGKYGLRTVEPSYQYYMKQYRYDKATGLKECQWNGPSWPYQTTQVLMGMANLIHNYHQNIITSKVYIHELQKYANQHFYKDSLNILENYNPDKNESIVYIDERSEHYNHSGFTNLIISGLCGIIPADGNQLKIQPIVSDEITYFSLQNLDYHGHEINLIYDKSGKKYSSGKGLSVFVDGKRLKEIKKNVYQIPNARVLSNIKIPVNLAVNLAGKDFPKATASFTNSLYNPLMAIDGRVWDFENVRNSWTNLGSVNKEDWLEINFEKDRIIQGLKVFFRQEHNRFEKPKYYEFSYWDNGNWKKLILGENKSRSELDDSYSFTPITTIKIRFNVSNKLGKGDTSITELEVY
ncbi:discoidin domain-containing protein [Pedobacter sp. Leaf194]|uniref:MGH1-like glycoside hydrolase domain-containing protein n=1 Tax=Pedobacter sp. Leaf194 TaxID=1736297 RepID=UPI00070257CF|nr:discoidin domain-containing protein [Pedobacter sp. Leaf194]KQS36763.1 hypothetical protein ASG14_06910 [Pedobacter sp. Leaf194]